MESIIKRIKKEHFWQFHGGIHPPEQKFLTCTKPIASVQIPEQLTIPIRQHIGQAGDVIVKVGEKVLKGQALTSANTPMQLPVHAPTSGTIKAIELAVIPHPSALSEPCIMLVPDGEDTWRKRNICPEFTLLSKERIVEKIANAGIAGMGGAGFPTYVKVGSRAKIDYLIINAAECEPYITADDLLIQEHSPSVLDGIKILDYVLAPKHILIGIEDNKSKAIEALKKATADIDHIHVCVIPTKYPSGGEKQLIKILTGKEVPSGVLPSSLGIVMQNVATCFAIADAIINDTPLIKRVVTVSGHALEKPQNTWALIGTPVSFLTQNCGYKNARQKHLIMGGPMMGFSLANDQIPVIKSTNCILAPSEIEIASPYSSTSSNELECIRCGQCADVCPANLLPQELQWYAKAKDQPQLKTLNLFDCIECGACAYVCPSQIPLVHYYRVAKAEIRQQELLDLKAEKAKIRFEARKQRLEKERLAREEKNRKAAEARRARMNANTSEAKSEKSAVAAALARVKAKKAQANTTQDHQQASNPPSDQKSKVANAIARAKAKKLAQQAEQDSNEVCASDTETPNTATSIDATTTKQDVQQPSSTDAVNTATSTDKQTKVAAAIAKAKAKKLAKQTSDPTAETDSENSIVENNADSVPTNTDKQAKVAAAIAKAKAKKLAKQTSEATAETDSENTSVENNADSVATNTDKQTKVAAAIAKAKAKKLAKQTSEPSVAADNTEIEKEIEVENTSSTTISSKGDDQPSTKSAANKEQTATDETSLTSEQVAINDKKAKIAAAVAKAKAKKLAQKAPSTPTQAVLFDEDSEQESAVNAESEQATAKKNNIKSDQTSTDDSSNETASESSTETKKARIAAAVAKAKAKKLAAQANTSTSSQTPE